MANIPQGFGFVAGRSGDKARELLALADKKKLDRRSAVRATLGGYFVDERLLDGQSDTPPERTEARSPESTDQNTGQTEAPAKSAAKGEWVTFAEAQGYDDSEGLTKDELIARYGG